MLQGVFGTTVELSDGRKIVADESYLRESIMNPSAKVVRGFPNPTIMPTFQGLVNEEGVMSLIEYIKSLPPAAVPAAQAPAARPAQR